MTDLATTNEALRIVCDFNAKLQIQVQHLQRENARLAEELRVELLRPRDPHKEIEQLNASLDWYVAAFAKVKKYLRAHKLRGPVTLSAAKLREHDRRKQAYAGRRELLAPGKQGARIPPRLGGVA